MRRVGAWLLAAMLCAAATPAAARVPHASPSLVRLVVVDADGQRMTFAQTLAVSTNGSRGWRSDAIYRIVDGTIVQQPALVNDGGWPAFRVTEEGEGLTLAWRTAHTGYSTLFVDALGAGFEPGATVNFTYRAALDYRRKLQDAVARRPAFVATPRFLALRSRAEGLIAQAEAASDPATRGALGQRALDVLAQAFERLLEDDGRQEGEALAPWWGVTVDRTSHMERTVDSINDLVDGHAGEAHARVVFDLGQGPAAYDAIVGAMQAKGIVVVGQILDSFPFHKLTLAQWKQRVRTFVDHFPQIDIWEIGNEVNGEWLGAQVPAKLEYAAGYVKAQDASDTTMLTVYWQMGTAGHPGNAVFQWIHDRVSPQLAADVDVVALSTWIGDAPLGLAHDEVFERLHGLFPGSRLAMGELGYWEPDTSRVWWWRSRSHPTTTVRRAVVRHMYLANLAFPYSVGGGFWWYYVQEMSERQGLWRTLRSVHRSIEA
ncbi:MAG: hypothetical protein ACXWFU_14645 [Actinomycetota bacterium]